VFIHSSTLLYNLARERFSLPAAQLPTDRTAVRFQAAAARCIIAHWQCRSNLCCGSAGTTPQIASHDPVLPTAPPASAQQQ
jgi:hypothetical protein